MEKLIVDFLLKHRYLLSFLFLVLTLWLALGAQKLYFNNDYEIFFNKDDPQKLAHQLQQDNYTKTDNLSILIQPGDKNIFTQQNLSTIQRITELGWQAPYSIRVDSITNFQYSYAEGDDLIVEDLVQNASSLTTQQVNRTRHIALSEEQLVNRLISRDGSTTLIDIPLELPPNADINANAETQAKQRLIRDQSFIEVVGFGRKIRNDLLKKFPDMTVHLMGVPVINRSFSEATERDEATLIPLMYILISISLAVFLRSIGSVISTIAIIAAVTVASMGASGWVGYSINTVNVTAPIIILTIAVCDCVHLLAIYLRNLSIGNKPLDAMHDSLRLNLQPIVLTSITTAVGFSTLNFSISPPFRELGNIAAFGVIYAMLLTLCLLPTLSLLLVRKHKHGNRRDLAFKKFANWLLSNQQLVFFNVAIITLLCISLIPLNKVDDHSIRYFKHGVPLRDAAEFSKQTLPGITNINFSLDCKAQNCVTEPEFLKKLKQFGDWLEKQPNVEKVVTYVNVISRINRNMNGDQPEYYRLPEDNDLAAQYHLVYELSLPQGLDLNNQINFDKSATLLRIFLRQITSSEIIKFEQRAEQWLTNNYPELSTRGTSIDMMFSVIGEKNIRSMMFGALLALIGITLTICIALKSVRYALISLIPNAFPAAIAFGLWGLLVGQVNVAVAAVFSITLGIIVDDTVHFISKYQHARKHKNLSPEQAIHYAFANVGSALLITTMVLALGFGILSLSTFNLNSYIGLLTAMTVTIALVFDYLILPLLLLTVDKN